MTLKVILMLLLIVNVAAFALMAIDKQKARAGAWRIPEKTLFLVAACFGALGGTLGMFLCHHKTKHWYFRFGFPALLVIQLFLLALFVALPAWGGTRM